MNEDRFRKRSLFLVLYIVFALLPIYWMVNMSFKTNEEILSSFSFFPQQLTWANYARIFTDESWYSGYVNSLIYVAINTVISLTVALPAAYAFSRYSCLGDKHVFFWLLTNRMTPPAVFRYIQLPKMRGVLVIAVLLRFMDSFMIYTEPFVLTGGGPGNATTFLSQYLTQKAVGQFDLGPAAAFSLIYFLIILLFCFVLYNWMQRVGTQQAEVTQ